MAIMDLQVSPRRSGTVSVSDAVASAHRLIEASGLQFMLHPMGTCVEGEADELYKLLALIHRELSEMGFERIGMSIKIDERLDRNQSMLDKISRVNELLD